MKIKFVEHAKERMKERGTSEEEVKTVLLLGTEISAKKGRKAKEMVFEYEKEWLGRIYPQKKVVVIYIEEDDEIVVITVKVFYGKWR
jgi:hypothetical protein